MALRVLRMYTVGTCARHWTAPQNRQGDAHGLLIGFMKVPYCVRVQSLVSENNDDALDTLPEALRLIAVTNFEEDEPMPRPYYALIEGVKEEYLHNMEAVGLVRAWHGGSGQGWTMVGSGDAPLPPRPIDIHPIIAFVETDMSNYKFCISGDTFTTHLEDKRPMGIIYDTLSTPAAMFGFDMDDVSMKITGFMVHRDYIIFKEEMFNILINFCRKQDDGERLSVSIGSDVGIVDASLGWFFEEGRMSTVGQPSRVVMLQTLPQVISALVGDDVADIMYI